MESVGETDFNYTLPGLKKVRIKLLVDLKHKKRFMQ